VDKPKIPTEVYSRCSGYFRPVAQWNIGKREEFSERRKMIFDKDEVLAPRQLVVERENAVILQAQIAQ